MKSITSNTLFERIIREEYNNAKLRHILSNKNLMQEQNLILPKNTSVDPTYKPKPAWTTALRREYKALILLGAKPYQIGIDDDGLELELYQNGKLTDRLRFKSDGVVYSQNQSKDLGFKLNKDGKSINILSDNDNYTDILGTIQKGKHKLNNYVPNPEKAAALKKAEEDKYKEEHPEDTSTIDRIQTVLDYAGIIPVIGDFIDIINAAIYFARGKWFDGILSSIAIVPIIGSATSLGLKTAGKHLRRLFKSKDALSNTDNLQELWKILLDKKILKKDEFAKLGQGFNYIAKRISSSGKQAVSSLPIGASEKTMIMNSLSEMENILYTFEKSADDILIQYGKTGLAKKSLKTNNYSRLIDILSDKPTALADYIGKNADVITQTGKRLSKRRLAKLPGYAVKLVGKIIDKLGYNDRKLKAIADVVAKRFRRDFDDPTLLTALLSANPFQKELLEKLSKTQLGGFIPKAYNAKAWDEDFIQILKTDPDFVKNKTYDQFRDMVIEFSTDPATPNPLYAMYKSEQANQLKAMFSKEMITSAKGWYANLLSKGKWLDVAGSEVEDLFEALGWGNEDEANGWLADYLVDSILNTELGKSFKKFTDWVRDSKYIKGISTVSKDKLGLDNPEYYDPNDYYQKRKKGFQQKSK